MRSQEALEIHTQLWSDTHPNEIIFRGHNYATNSTSTLTKFFTSVYVGDVHLITQNLRKPSPNTTWCRHGNKLTWVFKNGKYAGKIVSFVEDKKKIDEVFTFNPETLIYEVKELI